MLHGYLGLPGAHQGVPLPPGTACTAERLTLCQAMEEQTPLTSDLWSVTVFEQAQGLLEDAILIESRYLSQGLLACLRLMRLSRRLRNAAGHVLHITNRTEQ